MVSGMTSSAGIGWVRFKCWAPQVATQLAKYAEQKNGRNAIVPAYERGLFEWRRPLTDDGRGVAKGNEVSDFLRFCACALMTIPISTADRDRDRTFQASYRQAMRHFVEPIEHGWVRVDPEKINELMYDERITINIEISRTVRES